MLKPLLLLCGGYVASLLVMTTAPVFLDGATASLVSIGPLLFDVVLAAYLVVHYLGLRGLFRLAAYFFTFLGLVSIPSGILSPVGPGQS